MIHLFSPLCHVKCYLISFPPMISRLRCLTDILKSVESDEAVILRCVSDLAACSWERRPHCHHGQASASPPLEDRRFLQNAWRPREASASPAGTGLVPPTVQMSLPGAVGMGSDLPPAWGCTFHPGLSSSFHRHSPLSRAALRASSFLRTSKVRRVQSSELVSPPLPRRFLKTGHPLSGTAWRECVADCQHSQRYEKAQAEVVERAEFALGLAGKLAPILHAEAHSSAWPDLQEQGLCVEGGGARGQPEPRAIQLARQPPSPAHVAT